MTKKDLTETYRSSAEEVRCKATFASTTAPVKIGRAFVIDHYLPNLSSDDISDLEKDREIQILEQAFKNIEARYERIANDTQIPRQARNNFKEILNGAYKGIAEEMKSRAKTKIDQSKLPAETAIWSVYGEKRSQFEDRGMDQYIPDIKTVSHDIIREVLALKGRPHPGPSIANAPQDCMIAGDTIPTSETAYLLPKNIKAIVLTEGTITGHIPTLANDLGIPCCFVETLPANLRSDNPIIFDPHEGMIIFNPSDQTLESYAEILQEQENTAKNRLKFRKTKPALLDTGERVSVYANVTSSLEADRVNTNGADGIGLWRTEFFFTSSPREPTIEEQVEEYAYGLNAMKGARSSGEDKPCTFRLVDREGDKKESWIAQLPEEEFWNVKKRQIEAILRASAETGVAANILLPVVRKVEEVKWLSESVDELTEKLEAEGLTVPKPSKGMMAELPITSRKSSLKHFMPYVDFVSIGSNDMTAWMSGSLRGEEGYESFEDRTHPAILATYQSIIECCNEHEKPVSLCGRVASDPLMVAPLIALGLRRFSAGVENVLDVKGTAARADLADCQILLECQFNEFEQETRESLMKDFAAKQFGYMNGQLNPDWTRPEEYFCKGSEPRYEGS